MGAELIGAVERNERAHGDEAAVALGELRPLPNVAEQHVIGQLGELGRDVAHQLLGTRLLLCLSRFRGSWRVGLSLSHGGYASGQEARYGEQVSGEFLQCMT